MTEYINYLAIINFILILNFGLCRSDVTVYDNNNNTVTTYESYSAGFGPNFPDDGFEGYINLANPSTGCSKIDPPPNISYVDPSKWIALIQRTPTIFGNCSFDVKVFNAQLAGYSAVIIYNSDGDGLIKMSSNNYYKIKIPSAFIGHTNGIEIKNNFTYDRLYYVNISGDSDFSYFLIPFVSVVCVCFLTAVCIFGIKLILHCRKIRKNRFPRSALKKIPTKKYQKTDKYDTCPICLNEYEEGVKIRILPCEHVYHIECIDKWLLRNNRLCPVCKRRVIPGDSESENEETSGTSSTDPETQPLLVENEANDQDETNESTRLIQPINQEDNSSVLTTSTNLNNLTSASNLTSLNNNEISSLNNHMTRSITSQIKIDNTGPTILGQTRDLATSASRYGSISSINLIDTNPSGSNHDQISEELHQSKINSKQTPEYFSVPSESNLGESVEASTSGSMLAASNLDPQLQMKSFTKKKSSKSTEMRETSEKQSKKSKKKSNNKPITNKNLSKIAAKLEKENQRKAEDDDIEHFQSVNENAPLIVDKESDDDDEQTN